jgi:hypothetical protein
MDPASKSTLKIIGVIAIVAVVGAFGYNSMRKNSLEQTGRVYEQQPSFTIPCGGGSNIASVTTSNGECSSVTCSNGSIGNLPPAGGDGELSPAQAAACGATASGDGTTVSYAGNPDVMSCLIGVCIGITNNETDTLNNYENTKDTTHDPMSSPLKPKLQK